MSIDEIRTNLLECCTKSKALLIEGTAINLDKAPIILLEHAQFFSAFAAEKPTVVFYSQTMFEITDWVESELEAAGWDEENVGDEDGYWPSMQQVMADLEPHRSMMEKHAGKPYLFVALYTTEGVVRRMTFEAPWSVDLADLIEDMLEERMESIQLAHSRVDTSNIELMKQLIDEIAAREDFQAASGLPKKALLVNALYGEKIPKHPKGLTTRLKPNLDNMDVNFAHVLKTADEKAWVIKSVKK